MTAPVVRLCRGCSDPLPPKHLRVQLAPPDRGWYEVRTHDLACLIDWLQEEEEGPERQLFVRPEWRDHTKASPRA